MSIRDELDDIRAETLAWGRGVAELMDKIRALREELNETGDMVPALDSVTYIGTAIYSKLTR